MHHRAKSPPIINALEPLPACVCGHSVVVTSFPITITIATTNYHHHLCEARSNLHRNRLHEMGGGMHKACACMHAHAHVLCMCWNLGMCHVLTCQMWIAWRLRMAHGCMCVCTSSSNSPALSRLLRNYCRNRSELRTRTSASPLQVVRVQLEALIVVKNCT